MAAADGHKRALSPREGPCQASAMSSDVAIQALLQLRKGAGSRIGAERIRLLEAIAEQGSISSAARALGLSYKGAWDAVQALNNLFARPLVAAQTGGRAGGAASVTDAGRAVLIAYRKIETDLAKVVEQLGASLSHEGDSLEQILRSFAMKTSARNALRGVVSAVTPGQVNTEVTLRVSEGLEIVAIITRDSAEDLGLAPGREALALIKSSFVILVPGDAPLRTSARNRLVGTVIGHEAGAVNDEVVLDLGDGKTLTATITRGSGEDLGFKVGDKAQALVKASHVILAVD
jgi:molybdate transport system regulatory protein